MTSNGLSEAVGEIFSGMNSVLTSADVLDPHMRLKMYTQSARSAYRAGNVDEAEAYLDRANSANDEAKMCADRDDKTGLLKDATFKKDFKSAYALLDRSGVSFAIMLADVDKFKVINDTYGHPIGDVVLREVASRMGEGIRVNDGVYRYAGDEFAAIYSDVDLEKAVSVAQKIVNEVSSKPIDIGGGKSLDSSISAGIYVVSKDDDFNSAYEKVDRALYRAKEAGRNRVSI